MGLPISQHVLNTNHWVPGLRPFLSDFMERLLYGRDVFIGYVLTFSLVYELASQIRVFTVEVLRRRLYVPDYLSELASTTRLLLVQVVESGFVEDGLSVVDSGVAYLEVDVVLSLHALAVDEQVQLSHAGNDDFFVFGVLLDDEGWVFTLESVQSF